MIKITRNTPEVQVMTNKRKITDITLDEFENFYAKFHRKRGLTITKSVT